MTTGPRMPETPARHSAAYHSLTAAEVVRALDTNPEHGLSSAEAETRLSAFGSNGLEERRPNPPWRIFLAQFRDFMIYVLVVAVLISAIEGQVAEAVAILSILLLNGALGFVQEYRAERSLQALRELSAPAATVLRDGVERKVPAERLVPGDIVVLEAGDKVPADGRLVESGALHIDESALTGESAPVRKDETTPSDPDAPLGDRRCMVFAGTSVTVGHGRFVVTGTGQRTEMGRIADLLATTKDAETPLARELAVVGKRIAIIVLTIAVIVFAEEVFLELKGAGEGLLAAMEHSEFRSALADALLVAVALAVAAIPEGLPAIVTVALSLGVHRMAKHRAVVRRLHAVETLGSTTFICSDKTGTLTLNRMTARRVLVGEDEAVITPDWGLEPSGKAPSAPDADLLWQIAASCNDARFNTDGTPLGDPTEIALIDAASRLSPGHLRPKRTGENPFDPQRKRMATVHEVDGERVVYLKGAPDVVLELCACALLRGRVVEMSADLRASLSAYNSQLASQGFRTLAIAMRTLSASEPPEGLELEHDLTYVGIIGLVDPPRPEASAAVDVCHRAGIEVAMITGDHALTAKAIAEQVGLIDCQRVVTGPELDAMTDDELREAVREIRVYARVSPEHKLRIVDALKSHREVVAMTGDGVNDAPALKRADIGVAMGLVGTDVARESADMVLMDDDFSTIVEAVREGRIIFENLRKVIGFLLSCNMSEVLIVFITALASPAPVLLPLQILWINLVTDGPPALALGADKGSAAIMERPPRRPDESIITPSRQIEVVLQGGLMTVAGLFVFLGAGRLFPVDGASHVSTMLFTAMVLVQKAHAFSYLSDSHTVFSRETLRNRWLNAAFVVTLGLQMAVVYWGPAQRLFGTVALGARDWAALTVSVLVSVALIDTGKRFFAKWRLTHTRPEVIP